MLEVLEGASVTEVTRRFGVARQTVHAWLRRYASEGGMGSLADRSSRPGSCPHQMPPAVEERVLTLRLAHPAWGPDRILFQLGREHERGAAGRGRAVAVGGLPVSGSAPADRGAAAQAAPQ